MATFSELMDLVAAAGNQLKPQGDYARIIVVSSVVVFIFNNLHKLKDFDLNGDKAVKNGTFDVHKQYKASKHAQVRAQEPAIPEFSIPIPILRPYPCLGRFRYWYRFQIK